MIRKTCTHTHVLKNENYSNMRREIQSYYIQTRLRPQTYMNAYQPGTKSNFSRFVETNLVHLYAHVPE